MKWILINNHPEPIQEYHLIENEHCRVILKYNPEQKSARITCGNQQRLFFIQSAGVLTGKYIFTNEYGLQIGYLNQDKRHANGGSVSIESKKYQYEISNNPLAELTIYDSDSLSRLVTCELAFHDSTSNATAFGKQFTHIDYNCILLAHCWYLFLPVAKENLLEFAV
jgi:hypothetical protein